jgi:hypothetical protein
LSAATSQKPASAGFFVPIEFVIMVFHAKVEGEVAIFFAGRFIHSKGKFMFMSSIQKLKLLALIGATAALVACGGGGSSAPAQAINGNVVGNVSAANFAALTGTTFTYPNGLPDLGTTTSTTVTLGGTAAAPTATITSGGTSVVANVVFGSCSFTFTSPGFGRIAGFSFTYNICSYTFNTNGLFESFTPTQIPALLTLNAFRSNLVNINTVIQPGGALTVNGNSVGGSTVVPVTGATGASN